MGGSFVQLAIDLFPSSYDFGSTQELTQFGVAYKEYLSGLRQSGKLGKRKSIDFALPYKTFFYIQVLKEDRDEWIERLKKLICLENLQPNEGKLMFDRLASRKDPHNPVEGAQ
jgi:hypothetical protein